MCKYFSPAENETRTELGNILWMIGGSDDLVKGKEDLRVTLGLVFYTVNLTIIC